MPDVGREIRMFKATSEKSGQQAHGPHGLAGSFFCLESIERNTSASVHFCIITRESTMFCKKIPERARTR